LSFHKIQLHKTQWNGNVQCKLILKVYISDVMSGMTGLNGRACITKFGKMNPVGIMWMSEHNANA